MGYYVFSDYSTYYEGVRINVSDIEVTERPHPACAYDGASWTYPVAAARDYQYHRVARAMQDDLEAALATYYASTIDMTLIGAAMVEATAFEDDTGRSAGSVAFLNGWKTQAGSSTLQDAADDIQTRFAGAMEYMGKALAQKSMLFDSISAETDGETVLTYEWVPL